MNQVPGTRNQEPEPKYQGPGTIQNITSPRSRVYSSVTVRLSTPLHVTVVGPVPPLVKSNTQDNITSSPIVYVVSLCTLISVIVRLYEGNLRFCFNSQLFKDFIANIHILEPVVFNFSSEMGVALPLK